MAAEPSIIDSININYDGFFEQERKVASYLLQNPRQVVNMTIGELAAPPWPPFLASAASSAPRASTT